MAVVLRKLHGVLFQPTKAEFSYRAGYDGAGRLSVTHVVERGYSAMLKQPEPAAAWRRGGRTPRFGVLPRHVNVCGLFALQALAPKRPQSLNRWPRPNSPASASSTIMYRVLGRARPNTQRLMV